MTVPVLPFVSRVENKLDKKGRVSVPASFRAVLANDGFQGLYCIPTLDGVAIDCGGYGLLRMFEERLSTVDATSQEYDLLATAFYGESDVLTIDTNGRIMLPERLKESAQIEKDVVFVGKGKRFQIWSPEAYESYRGKALEAARGVLWGQKNGEVSS